MEALDLVIKAFANPSKEHTQVYIVFVVVTILIAVLAMFLYSLVKGDDNLKVTLEDFDPESKNKKPRKDGESSEIRD